jgi:hypothetical protein
VLAAQIATRRRRNNPIPNLDATKATSASDYVDEKDMHKAVAVTPRPDLSAGLTATTCPARASPSKTFQFVTAHPSSEAERSQNKVLVRSNASNYHWRRVKKNADGGSNRPRTRRRSSNHGQLKSSKRVLAPATPQTISSSATESEGPTPKTEEEHIECIAESPVSAGELVIFSPESLSTLVVSGHHDPFETYPCDLPKEFVSPVLDQGR